MLYVPPPYSSGVEVSVCEQDAYCVSSTPPSPPTNHAPSNSCYKENTEQNSTSQRTSPPPTPKETLNSQNTDKNCDTHGNDEDDFFFLGQLQNKTVALGTQQKQQQQQQEQKERDQQQKLQQQLYQDQQQQQQQQQEQLDYLVYDQGFEEAEDHSQYDYQNQYYQSQHAAYTFEPFDKTLYSTTNITDDDFETANRAFHATINKFSRQSYPEHRKRAPYNFLESWHLHSMYSKSQQILLGIPHVRPMVLLSGDDFMFTPPLLQQEEEEGYIDENDHQLRYLDQSMHMEWMDDGQMFEDDGEILDDGIVIMSAPDPPIMVSSSTSILPLSTSPSPPPTTTSPSSTILNENAWMKNQVDSLLQHQHVYSPVSSHHYQQDLQMESQQEDDLTSSNTEPLYFAGLSSELVHWYRSSERGRPPSTIMQKMDDDDQESYNSDNVHIGLSDDRKNNDNMDGNDMNEWNDEEDCNNRMDDKSNSDQTSSNGYQQTTMIKYNGLPTSYQSLADIVASPSSSPIDERMNYGSTFEQQQYASASSSQSTWINHRTLGFTDQLVATSELVMKMASDYRVDRKANTLSYISCLFRIWQVLFLTAEIILSNLWGQPSDTVTSNNFMIDSKSPSRRSPVEPLLPF
ncbi:uncharacterized protein BX664DRAFT_319761 [Halteromyces radiatus]|uniref:uncharacterized protein n=1 Tax=Halteromyces radiatus TaxID=101107 RepID=UPI00221EF54D|nr:uncharacterized protein BX664DRAFT_319761 [Halteromyces radiatus]KAI8098855.1 hypothetical protein BX664DRAFT_319761 [Halteromyces radiatus]